MWSGGFEGRFGGLILTCVPVQCLYSKYRESFLIIAAFYNAILLYPLVLLYIKAFVNRNRTIAAIGKNNIIKIERNLVSLFWLFTCS